MIECHLSVMSQQTTTATNQASVMQAVIHAWYISGLISRSVYFAIADSGPRGPRYIGAALYYSVVFNPQSLRQGSKGRTSAAIFWLFKSPLTKLEGFQPNLVYTLEVVLSQLEGARRSEKEWKYENWPHSGWTRRSTRGPRATVRSPDWHSHCRHADVMQHFSNPIIATNENIIIWAVLSFEEEYMGLTVNGAWSFE